MHGSKVGTHEWYFSRYLLVSFLLCFGCLAPLPLCLSESKVSGRCGRGGCLLLGGSDTVGNSSGGSSSPLAPQVRCH